MSRKKKRLPTLLGVLLAVILMAHSVMAAEYTITASMDYTGPYAVLIDIFDAAGKSIFAWWNETKGKELGITVKRKLYDMRYDPSVVASTWPGILTGDKPIVHLGLGGADVAALMKRLPKDKVPMIMSTGTYGFIWLPNQWVFQPRPTYVHEMAGFLNWVRMNQIKDRPIRLGIVNSKVSPAYVDMVNGAKAWDKVCPWVEIVGVEWVKMKPVSLVSEVRRLARKKPDFIYIGTNTAHVIGTIKAQKELGIHIPIVGASHCGVQMSAVAAKDITHLEGHYESAAMDPGIDPNIPGTRIIREYSEKLGLKATSSVLLVQAGIMNLLALRAVERASELVGPDEITGEVMYRAMYVRPFTEEDLLGFAPTMTFTKEAPFSTKNPRVKCLTVKNGKPVLVSKDWIPIPELPKWVKKK